MADVLDKMLIFIITSVLLVIAPVILVANRLDQSAQSYMDSVVISFVDNVRVMGKIVPEEYERLVNAIDIIQPCCDIDITISGKEVIPGEDGDIYTYYRNMYKYEIIDKMYDEGGKNSICLSNGDYIRVVVKTTQPTLAQRMLSIGEYVPLYVTYGGWVRSSG